MKITMNSKQNSQKTQKSQKDEKSFTETLHVVTIAMIWSTLDSFRKFQYFRRHIYNSVEHL